MKINSEKFSFWTFLNRIEKYGFPIFTTFVSLMILSTELTKPNIEGKEDIVALNGTIRDYSFTLEKGYRNTLYHYYFWLNEYECTFQIKADFQDFFREYDFKGRVKSGDNISISIANENFDKINNNEERVFVMSVRTPKHKFLSLDDTIEKEKSPFMVIFALVFMSAGWLYYYLNIKQKEN